MALVNDAIEYRNVMAPLYQAFNLLAPDGTNQRAFVRYIQEMEIEGMDHNHIISAAVAALYDGAACGNWVK